MMKAISPRGQGSQQGYYDYIIQTRRGKFGTVGGLELDLDHFLRCKAKSHDVMLVFVVYLRPD